MGIDTHMKNIKGYTEHIIESYNVSDIRLGPIEQGTKITELTRRQQEYKSLIFDKLMQKLEEKTIEGWTIVAASPDGQYYSSSHPGTTFNAGVNIPSAGEGDDIIIFGPFFDNKDWFLTLTATFDGERNRDVKNADLDAYDIWQHMTGDLKMDSEFIIDMIRHIIPIVADRIRKRNRSRGAFGRF
jgi:hypothetical protein